MNDVTELAFWKIKINDASIDEGEAGMLGEVRRFLPEVFRVSGQNYCPQAQV